MNDDDDATTCVCNAIEKSNQKDQWMALFDIAKQYQCYLVAGTCIELCVDKSNDKQYQYCTLIVMNEDGIVHAYRKVSVFLLYVFNY
jgi:apolipoprotein N-acyltransferase